MNLILQTESSECGLACLAMVASHYGNNNDLATLRRKFSISLKGLNLAQLIRHANAMHLATRPLRVELDELSELSLPCIMHWDLNHFIVLKRVHRNWQGKVSLVVLDPAVGERRVSLQEASKYFTGVVLEVSPSAAFEASEERRQISVGALTGHIVGLRRALAQIILLALALEIFTIASPLFNQFVIDEVIVSGDRELLVVLVFGFALMMVTQTSIGLARSWFLMRWSMEIGYQWTGRVFAHLIRLPVSFFEKRHLGDIVSRFGSIGAIQNTLTSLFVESLLDGLMALLALVMMLMYSPKLTALVILGTLLYALLRWMFYHPFRSASQERLVLAAKESTHFLETLRAITPLKLYGREAERASRWQNLRIDVQNRDIKTQKLSILFRVANTAIFGGQGLAVLYTGAGIVMKNGMSVGMLMAFCSFASTFSVRFFNLIDLCVNLKMLTLHTERLCDIVLEDVEQQVEVQTDVTRLKTNITLRNLRFRYSDGEPWVLNGINLKIPAGQSIAFVGPSGCGKTTLCKIILGLLKPTEGEVLIDEIPIQQLGLQAYRQLVGTVMQDDVLLAGSVQDNISFFDPCPDVDRVQQCAIQAAVHGEIIAMPMGYQTLVGDLGSSLSGGQKQRVLLARALYKQPKILALDEATSHLDITNEKLVNDALGRLSLTRIMVAHRPETIDSAERVVELRDGLAIEIPRPMEGCSVEGIRSGIKVV